MSLAKPKVVIKDPRRFYPEWLKKQERQLQTYSATEDDLLSDLATRWEAVVVNNGDGERRTFAKKYNRQAIDIILYHAKTGHVRDFVIKDSDLQRHTRYELTNKRIGGTPKEYHQIVDEIFSNAVRRLFEELDLVYYHNNLAGKLHVRLEP
jgi:hypothetical protein